MKRSPDKIVAVIFLLIGVLILLLAIWQLLIVG